MKNLILFFALFLFKNAHAQIDKGIWIVGGSGSFYSYTEDYSMANYNQTAKITSIDLAGSIGYFLLDKFAAGIRPYLSTYNSKVLSVSTGSGGSTYKFQLAAGPFVRYYFLNKDKPFNILVDFGYQFGSNKVPVTPVQKGKFNTLFAMGGIEIFFNSTAGMEILLGYKQQIESLTGNYDRNKKGLQILIGFTLHLEKL